MEPNPVVIITGLWYEAGDRKLALAICSATESPASFLLEDFTASKAYCPPCKVFHRLVSLSQAVSTEAVTTHSDYGALVCLSLADLVAESLKASVAG